MQEKKVSPTIKNNLLPLYILICTITFIICFFSIYEFTNVGNPFMDPITPYILWGGMSLIILSLTFRIFQALHSK